MDSGMVENMGPEKICCNCRWHEEYTWVCFNGLSLNCTDVTDVEDNCEHWEKRTDEKMTTKRMKKLLMGMGLSRNQATRMIQEQRTEGSKDVSNALYFHVFQKDFNLIVSSCGGEVLPYLNSFVLK